jgi:hypothetical protein
MKSRVGSCSSIESAIKSGPESDVVEGTGSLVVDGSLLCYDLRSKDDKTIVDPSGKTPYRILPGQFILRGKDFGMTGVFPMAAASIGSMSKPEAAGPIVTGAEYTTWNGVGGISTGDQGVFGNIIISQPKDGVKYMVQDGGKVLGVDTKSIALRFDSSALSFFVDENRGFIPIKTQTFTSSDATDPYIEIFVTDVRECSGRRWFPMRAVAVWINGTGERGKHWVHELQVTRLDVDNRPQPEEFSIALDAGFAINDPSNGEFPQYKIARSEVVNLNNLSEFYQRTRNVSQGVLLPPAPPANSRRMFFVCMNLIAIMLLLVAFGWWRGWFASEGR